MSEEADEEVDISDVDEEDDAPTSSSGGSWAVSGGANVMGGAPFQTEGGVIMPEGGANPCVIKVRRFDGVAIRCLCVAIVVFARLIHFS